MGKIKQGILGGFKGKVGTVVGSSWNGIAYIVTFGNAPTDDLPAVTVLIGRNDMEITWDVESEWRVAHADEYPTFFVANVTQKKIFLVHSSIVIGASGARTLHLNYNLYGVGSDSYSGFMLSTGATSQPSGFGTLSVTKRPARKNS